MFSYSPSDLVPALASLLFALLPPSAAVGGALVLLVVSIMGEDPGSSPRIFSNCAVADRTASVLPVMMYFVAVFGPAKQMSLGIPSSSSFSPSFPSPASSSISSSFSFIKSPTVPSTKSPLRRSFFLRMTVFVLRCTFLIFPKFKSLEEGVQIFIITDSAVVPPSLPFSEVPIVDAPSAVVVGATLLTLLTSTFSTITPVGIHRSPATILNIFTKHSSTLSISPSS
mmetsp:Transcript_8529/g.14955  ORF Transcript_8529/g.14955 Transcript_8529/m.14955 type:complete len:226 (+) Transcript_8529:273-950(+)